MDDNKNEETLGGDPPNGDTPPRRTPRGPRIRKVKVHPDGNRGYYVRYPVGHPRVGKKRFFVRRVEAEAEAARLNAFYRDCNSAHKKIPEQDFSDFVSSHPVLLAIREIRDVGLSEIFRDYLERQRRRLHQKSLGQLRGSYLRKLRSEHRSAHLITDVTTMKLPEPELRVPLADDEQGIRDFIARLIRHFQRQWDRNTGLRLDKTTRAHLCTNVAAILGQDRSVHSGARMIVDHPSFRFLLSDDLDPKAHDARELELLLAYLQAIDPVACLAHFLQCKVGFRTSELERMCCKDIDIAAGIIRVTRFVGKKTGARDIRREHVDQVFRYFEEHPGYLRAPNAPLVGPQSKWGPVISRAFRDLFWRPYPMNVGRHSAGTTHFHLLPSTDDVSRIMGHRIRALPSTVINHYLDPVGYYNAKALSEVVPLPLTGQIEADVKWRLCTTCINLGASTLQWRNTLVTNQHHLNTDSPAFVDVLRKSRPIFPYREGRVLLIDFLAPDATRTLYRIECTSVKEAKRRLHRLRVAVWTGVGIIDFETGEVAHYERNFGVYCGEATYRLENPERLEEELVRTRTGYAPLGRRVGYPSDWIVRLAQGRDTRGVPESVKQRLEEFCPGLNFVSTGRTKRKWNIPRPRPRTRSTNPSD